MFYAYTRPRYQVGVYRTIGPLVYLRHILSCSLDIYIHRYIYDERVRQFHTFHSKMSAHNLHD